MPTMDELPKPWNPPSLMISNALHTGKACACEPRKWIRFAGSHRRLSSMFWRGAVPGVLKPVDDDILPESAIKISVRL
jgi:hypothetical protein